MKSNLLLLLNFFSICLLQEIPRFRALTHKEKQDFRSMRLTGVAKTNSRKFEEFCENYGYSHLRDKAELKLKFEEKRAIVEKRNQEYLKGNSTVLYKLGPRSMKEAFLKPQGLVMKNIFKQRIKRFITMLPCDPTMVSQRALKKNFTWRSVYEAPVLNQGDSSACWATSSAASLQYYTYIYENRTTSPSVQQGCDCAIDADCESGGLMCDFFDMCLKTGTTSDLFYPFVGHTASCKLTNSMTRDIYTNTFRSYCYASKNETLLALYIASYGPATAAISSSSAVFNFYDSGVITPRDCNTGDVDHAILITGFGTDPITGLDYWECKNSWGPNWGEKGYFRIQRGVNCCFLTSYTEALMFLRP